MGRRVGTPDGWRRHRPGVAAAVHAYQDLMQHAVRVAADFLAGDAEDQKVPLYFEGYAAAPVRPRRIDRKGVQTGGSWSVP